MMPLGAWEMTPLGAWELTPLGAWEMPSMGDGSLPQGGSCRTGVAARNLSEPRDWSMGHDMP